METLRLTKEELEAAYADERWREALYDVSRLVDFLADSILKPKYVVPDSLVAAIPLTEAGTRLMQKLITRHEVPAKEARVLCLLRLVHREPLVDLDKLDVETLRLSVESQILDRNLQYPFILGRRLYDRAAEMFPEARDSLTHDETVRLLEDQPIGVFQSGQFVSGPFGLLRSRERRWLAPLLTVPLYHCSDITCRSVHRTRLQSDATAAVNIHQSTFERVSNAIGEDRSEWGRFIDSIGEVEGLRFDDRSREPITLALGDLFDDDELGLLLADILDHDHGDLRGLAAPLGISGKAEDAVSELNRAQRIQLLLLVPNTVLVERIDRLVYASRSDTGNAPVVNVAGSEVRRLMTNRALSYGTYSLFPELSRMGLRFASHDYSLGPMRLKRLVEELYDLDDLQEVSELQWQLRGVEGDDPHEQLEEFVRSARPNEVVQRLILAREVNQVLSAQRLGLDFADFADDGEFTSAVLWKLGFYIDDFSDHNSAFWSQHERLKRYAQTAGIGARVDIEELRSRAVNYFVELEGLLDDSLAYATWALTNDHFSSSRPFSYSVRSERIEAFRRLNEQEATRSSGDESITLGDKNTLFPLIRGFGILHDLLQSTSAKSADYARPVDDYPTYSKHTSLKKFAFDHTVAFLDLVDAAKLHLLTTLSEVKSGLVSADVHNVRNEYTHYRSTSADLSRLQSCLDAVERAVYKLEADGLCRLTFGLVNESGDNWDRRVYTFRNARGREVAFARPSAHDWNQMPSMKAPQYVVVAAVFARPNDALRFRAISDTRYSDYWDNYPKRRTRRSVVESQKSVVEQGTAG